MNLQIIKASDEKPVGASKIFLRFHGLLTFTDTKNKCT